MVCNGRACTKYTGEPHVCAPDDVPDCKLQCERGNQESCAHYGVELLKGQKVAPDPPKGKTLLEGACSAGIGKACNGLGVINAKGLVGAKDLPKAMKFYEQACEQGYMNACFNVAYAHDIGQGVPVDQDSAALYYVRSCAGGVGLGCMNLGIKLIEKKGHEAEGAALLARGCSGGVGHACHKLALAQQRGEGVPKDETRAKTLYRQACDMGHAPACGFAN